MDFLGTLRVEQAVSVCVPSCVRVLRDTLKPVSETSHHVDWQRRRQEGLDRVPHSLGVWREGSEGLVFGIQEVVDPDGKSLPLRTNSVQGGAAQSGVKRGVARKKLP